MKSLSKLFIAACFFLFSGRPASAEGSDSILYVTLHEVQVQHTRGVFYGEDHHVSTLSAAEYGKAAASSLGELLSLHFPAAVKTYGGNGNLASASLRGTSSQHTQVNWNGFPLNNASSGDADLSLLPVLLADRISLIRGASASLYGSGTFGGAIDLTTESSSLHRFSSTWSNETSAFGGQMNAFDVKAGTSALQYKGSFYQRKAENNFSYVDSLLAGFPRRRMTHNELMSWGLLQQVSLALPGNNRLEAGLWYQDRDKNLPETMGSLSQGLAEQADSSLKVFLKYSHSSKKTNLTVKTAWFSDHLRYTEKIAADNPGYLVYSLFHIRQLFADVSYRVQFRSGLFVDAAILSNQIHADVLAYGREVEELHLAGLLAAKMKMDRMVINTSMRIERAENGPVVLLPSLGGKYSIVKETLDLRFNISRKFRQPTLNEKYWAPGGNPDLKPENGWGAETGLSLQELALAGGNMKLDITAYTTHIKDYVLWTGENFLLSPENVEKIWARGLETSISHEYSFHAWKLTSGGSYDFTHSTILENSRDPDIAGRRLRYIPLHAASLLVSAGHRWLNLGLIISYSGSRFVSETLNSKALSPYAIASPWASVSFNWKGLQIDSRMQVYNVFNKAYQLMAAYPMPGRYLSLTSRISFSR